MAVPRRSRRTPGSLNPVSRLGEFGLIRRLTRRFGRASSDVLLGIGDDAAAVRPPPGFDLLVTTDLLLEGIDFDWRYSPPERLGAKAVTANVSDLAAMGGIGGCLLIFLGLEPRTPVARVDRIYAGVRAACRRYDLDLIGGDVSRSRKGMILGFTAVGWIEKGSAIPRSGARPGDWIWVSGWPGESAAGLELLRSGRTVSAYRRLARRHLDPEARVGLGRALARGGLATAMIDVSDGLAADLGHLCEASRVAAELEVARLPVSPQLAAYARRQGRDPIAWVLGGGEDFELLFTAPPDVARRIEALATPDCPVHAIGRVLPRRSGLRLRDPSGRSRPLPRLGHEHFHR